MHKTLIKNHLLLFATMLISGCSTASFSDLFSHYNQQMSGVKYAQQRGNFQQAISLIPLRSQNDGTYGLSLLEKARLEYLANNNEQSQRDFAQTYKLVQQTQQAAKIELSSGIENVTAVMSNDNAVRYNIPLYEQSMMHSYQALNYLSQQNLSGALVEVRRANLVQEQALKNNIHRIDNHQDKTAERFSQFPAMDEAIGNIKNGFQNAYTFYLSALFYEMAGQANDAYIDYKKALEIYPDNSYLQQDVWRLANNLQMSADVTLFKARFEHINANPKVDSNQGEVVFIIENGIVPAKQEIAINLPFSTSHDRIRFYSVALPSYQNRLNDYSPFHVSYKGKNYQSQEIVRLQSLAAKQLKDQMPAIVTRQIARLIAKEELRQHMTRENGALGNIFASIYNVATEKADTRSWSTLPDSIHLLRLRLPVGEHQLMMNINGTNKPVNVSVSPNKISLVTVAAIGTYTHAKTFNL